MWKGSHTFKTSSTGDLSIDQFGMCKKTNATELDRMVVAIKRFKPQNRRRAESVLKNFQRERQNLLSVTHIRLVKLLASFEVKDPNFGHLNLILPYANCGDLDNLMQS